jgi:hypothetical protein
MDAQVRRELEDERERQLNRRGSSGVSAIPGGDRSCLQEPLKLVCHPGVRISPSGQISIVMQCVMRFHARYMCLGSVAAKRSHGAAMLAALRMSVTLLSIGTARH